MIEFDVGKLLRLVVVAFVIIFLLRTCTYSTMGSGGQGYYGGGGGFFSGLFLGQMMRSNKGYDNGADRTGKNVRRGSAGSGSGRSRSGGFGFGK